MILPGIGANAGLSKSAPVLRGSVQVAINDDWEPGDWSPDIAAHEAGDVLVVVIGAMMSHTANPAFDPSSGWTTITYTVPATRRRIMILRRTAVSSATTLTLTSLQAPGADIPQLRAAVHSWALRFANGAVEAAQSDDSRDPPSLTPSWGSENNYWIAAAFGNGTPPTDPPAGFDNATQSTSSTVHLSTADLAVEAPSVNPSAFDGTAATGDKAFTIAVRPA